MFLRVNVGFKSDGIYRVEHISGDELTGINIRGVRHIFYLSWIRNFNSRDCILLKGPTAELLNIIFLGVKPFYENSLMYRSELRRRLERAVPSRLWVE